MFRIGEFAQIAQVSGRQLRYYDQLGLLHPEHVDRATGYRYYSVRQLPRLNAILALKELGLTLEQIGPLIDRAISPEELRGMLVMRRAQIGRLIAEEEARLRHIESRIAEIDTSGALGAYDVVVKSVDARPFLSARRRCEGMDDAVSFLKLVAEAGASQIRPGLRDRLAVVSSSDFDAAILDIEVGYTLRRSTNRGVDLGGGERLQAGELPAVETMATLARSGPGYESHRAFGAIGTWIEVNGYEIVGPCREVFLEPFAIGPDPGDVMVEIQYPVRRQA